MFPIVRVAFFAAVGVCACHLSALAQSTSPSEVVESVADDWISGWSAPGASFGQRPLQSTTNVKLVDPMKFRRITWFDNDNPDSFFYTFRPNIFNIAVDDEWDWYNLINTDRSDFTDTPFTVGKGITYLESGFTNARVTTPDAHSQLRTLPESLIRTGLTDKFELRFKWTGYEMLNQEDPHTGASGSAFGGSDIDIGAKWNLMEQEQFLPMTTFVGGLLLPTGTNGFSGNSVQPHFNLVNGWGVRRWLFVKHQFGLDHLTQPSFSVDPIAGTTFGTLQASRPTVNSFHSSISCLFQVTKRIGGFAEWYVLYGSNQPTMNFMDAGYFFYLTPSIQFDGVVGSSIAVPNNETLFVKMGFSTRW